jgi:hypothetical protein
MNLKNKAARAAVERKLTQRRGKPQTVVTVERSENTPPIPDMEREAAEAKITELEHANAMLRRRVRSVREAIEG